MENSIFDHRKEKYEQYFDEVKESDNKIQIVVNQVRKYFMEYCSFLKDRYKQLINELENLEKLINSSIIDEEVISGETPIYSKSDFGPKEKDFNSNKYKIEILKSKQIPIEGPEIKHEERTKSFFLPAKAINNFSINNISKEKLFKENYLFLKDKDIYEIVSKLYSFNLKLLDKSHYDLDIEKGKLLAMEFSKEILLYNEGNEEIKNKFNEKYDEIIDSIDKKILNNTKNIESFFIALNNYRVKGKIKFSEKFYDLIIYIFKKTLDELLKVRNKKLSNSMLILSQTYYKEKDGKKIYILDSIKTHELFKNIDFWKSVLINKIEEEIKVVKNFNEKNGLSSTINQEKKEEIIKNKFIFISDLMKDCDLDKDIMTELINHIFDKYKCSTNTRKEIFSINNQKK